MCTKDFTCNNLSYFYITTNNTWDSSNQKVKISRAASRKCQDFYNPIYFSHDYSYCNRLTGASAKPGSSLLNYIRNKT